MSRSHLTSKYRPKRFAEVVGQETTKTILSRASEGDAVAPAYMFSGTRGVGKTTIARILAKAVNCVTAPTAEPCCECVHCKQIAAGASVDVIEIDAASHTGVDNIRSLKEDVGYSPMESRYKVFIIDEAHMLSKSAFNALLKTLEEPPPRVVFIMATTEPRKFPATIISRCQHFVFQRLPQGELEAHLANVLGQEGVDFEAGAVRLIARRGAGSVRDSMSLLGQVLALSGESLSEADTREVLGLAGQDVFYAVVDAVRAKDCLTIVQTLSDILDRGLDIGFFMSELTSIWRNLFLLSQAGKGAFPVLDLPEEQAEEWLARSQQFSATHVHAAWQLTLEAQRKVKLSLEPGLALEHTLLNLAYLPDLLELDEISPGTAGGQGGGQARPAPRPTPAQPSPAPQAAPKAETQQEAAPEPPAAAPKGPRTWDGFMAFCTQNAKRLGLMGNMLVKTEGRLEGNSLIVNCGNGWVAEQVDEGGSLTMAAKEYFGPEVQLACRAPEKKKQTIPEMKGDACKHPTVQAVMQEFGVGDIFVTRRRT